MTNGPPRLLQPWGVIALALIVAVAFAIAYRWHRAKPGRAALHLDVAAVALLAFFTGGFFWRPLTESGVMMPAGGGDLASFYFPTYKYVSEQIKSGTIPLWNPHLFAGMPLAADIQSALFYPINLMIFLFVNVDYGVLEWALILHYFLAATFTYLFLRDIGLRRLGAFAGGIAFAFSGFMVAHFGHLPMVAVASWIPLALLCLRRALLTRSPSGWAWAIGAGLSITMSLLAGHAQIFAYGLMAAGLLWLYLLLGGGEPLTVRSITPWVLKGALALVIALGIGAVQLLPSLELSTQSVRASVSYEEASQFPNQPISMLNLFLPTVYGSSPTTYSFGEYQTTENWGYSGVITLVLAAAGLVLKRGRMVGFFAILVALALIIMVGDLSIVGGWIYKFVPGFNKLRDSGRALMLFGFGLAGLAAYGLDGLTAALSSRGIARRNAFWWLVGLSGALAIAAFGIMPALYKEILLNNGAEYGKMPGAINDMGMLIIWLGLLAGITWAAFRGRVQPQAAGAAMALLLILDLFSPNSQFNPTTQNLLAGFQNYDAIAQVRKLTQDRTTALPYRVNSDTDVQNIWQPSTAQISDLYDTGGAWNPLKLARYDELWTEAKKQPNSPLYDLTGALAEIASPAITHTGQPKWQLVQRYDGFNVNQDKNVMPRLFLVHDSRIEPDPAKQLEDIEKFYVDPRHSVLLESGTPTRSDLPGTAEAAASGKPTTESVRATRYTPNEVDIEVKANAPGWVVLTDAWYPGWQATMDNNQSVPIEPAFYAYRAVRVDAGTHTISMQFRPATWVWGRAVSLASIVITLLALAWLLARGRRLAKRDRV